MITFDGIGENLNFILIEARSIVAVTHDYLRSPDPDRRRRIIERDDYIDNLKTLIEKQCFARIHREKDLPADEVNRIRAIHIICVNLERAADLCVNIIRQRDHLRAPAFLESYAVDEPFRIIQDAIDRVRPALDERDMGGALAVCRAERDLDRLYKRDFDDIMRRLRAGGDVVEDLITALFIVRYLERIGDMLLNVGEALIFAILGERIKIHQYRALEESLGKTGFEGPLEGVELHSYLGTRSGCRISRVEPEGAEGDVRGSIFKEGNPQKIRREKESLERWETLFPGLAPRVISYGETDHTASMLVTFLPGYTLDEIALGADERLLRSAFDALRAKAREVWEKTKRPGPVPTDYMSQTIDRLERIREVHPGFFRMAHAVGGSEANSTEDLIRRCAEIEKGIPAPQSVFVHGDFNVNNILYDTRTGSVHYIDLHRSRDYDFVKDVSVFLISNFRMPLFGREIRERLNRMIRDFHRLAAGVAMEWKDPTFEVRMSLALARSLFTSTRFELNARFAKEMYLRANFLLEKVLRHHGSGRPWEEYVFPDAVLYE